ncbi:Protein of unknown function [Lactobacillus helveticus CIRM-BIA 101]|uniref:Transposase n=1 Tax=Lactobacillus helveticus CIRM-BIA 104 TaxID=1226333 RepID=U6FDG6_LACHE|nr:Protein of unknown function [Lactobacillus helveticus CIRM-BIA 104]CDI66167.1 Protein of unknown function [Lactobacillus helveticus CIRM-BIA 101]
MRNLKVTKAIGSCESNHRKYTYRVKAKANTGLKLVQKACFGF